jgi:carboxymethylenebutenolidase
MTGQDIDIAGPDGTFTGYLALPPGGRGPGVVVIQEVFGVNTPLRQITDLFAGQGYMALAPDLFWRQQPGVQLDAAIDADFQRALAFYKGFDVDAGIRDIQTTIDALRERSECTGKVGTTGYCLGGYLAYLAACRTDAEAHAGYYGVGIERKLDEAAAMRGHLVLHIAEEDGFVPKDAQKAVVDGLHGNPKAIVHTYPGADHGFARIGGGHYDRDAADLANSRTLALFKTHLF